MHAQSHYYVSAVTKLCSTWMTLFHGSSPWAATGSMDQKLIIWDLQHSSPRSTCDHEVCFYFVFNETYSPGVHIPLD